MDKRTHTYRLDARGIDDLRLITDGGPVRVDAGEVREGVVRLQVDPYNLTRRSSEVTLVLQAIDDASLKVEEDARFVGPVPRGR